MGKFHRLPVFNLWMRLRVSIRLHIFNLPAIYSKMQSLKIVCRKEAVGSIIEVIHKYGSTGKKDDGMIYVLEVLQVSKSKNRAESV